MKRSKRALWGLCCVLFGLGSVSIAVALSADQLEVRTYAGIPYLSGGVGLDERDTLRSLRQGDNLQLIFADTEGHYLSDVAVLIIDETGRTVLEAVSQGPWFFTKLPAGTYHIKARTLGQSLQQVARVSATGPTRLYFYWRA